MKRSFFVLISGLSAVTLTLSACLDSSSSSSARRTPIRIAAKGQNGANGSDQTADNRSRIVKRTGTSLADQCFNNLCSQNTTMSIDSMLKDAEKGSPKQNDYYKKNILPLLQKKSENYKQLTQARLSRFESQEKNFATITLNSAQEKLIKAFMLMYASDAMTASDRAQAELLSKALTNIDFQRAHSVFQIRHGKSYFATLYKEIPLATAIQKEVTFIEETRKAINTALNASLVNIDNSSFDRAQKNQELSSRDIEAISNLSYGIRLMSFFLSDQVSGILEKIQLQPDDLQKLYAKSNIKANLEKLLASSQKDLAECETKFYQTLNLYPQANEIEKFKKLEPLIRESASSLLSSQDATRDIVLKAAIRYPKSADQAAQDWIADLQSNMEYESNEIKRYATYDDATLFTFAVIFARAAKDRNHLCQDLVDLDITDKTLPVDESISLSWLSIKQPQLGMSILAHELGHIVDLYSSDMGTERLCLREKQSSDQYAAEDFADWFSARVALQLEKNQHLHAENLGCFLAMSDKTLSLTNSSKEDSHSSHLFRALQFAAGVNQKIPQTCSTLASQESSKATQACQ